MVTTTDVKPVTVGCKHTIIGISNIIHSYVDNETASDDIINIIGLTIITTSSNFKEMMSGEISNVHYSIANKVTFEPDAILNFSRLVQRAKQEQKTVIQVDQVRKIYIDKHGNHVLSTKVPLTSGRVKFISLAFDLLTGAPYAFCMALKVEIQFLLLLKYQKGIVKIHFLEEPYQLNTNGASVFPNVLYGFCQELAYCDLTDVSIETLDLKSAKMIKHDLEEGLQTLDSAKITHYDLNKRNFFLRFDPVLKIFTGACIGDFELAKQDKMDKETNKKQIHAEALDPLGKRIKNLTKKPSAIKKPAGIRK